MTDPAPARRPRLRVARGPRRPRYLEPHDNDRLFLIVTALMAEVSVLADRIDTHERLALAGQVATPEAIEAFIVPAAEIARRAATREAMLRRVFRVVLEELDALPEPAP